MGGWGGVATQIAAVLGVLYRTRRDLQVRQRVDGRALSDTLIETPSFGFTKSFGSESREFSF